MKQLIEKSRFMNEDKLEIQIIHVKNIYQYACKIITNANQGGTLPITKHLALAYANNPYADKDDPALFVAYKGKIPVGYLATIPGLLRNGKNLAKIYWFSTLFVASEYRATGAGVLLLKSVLSLPYDIVGSGPSKMAEKVLRGLGLIGRIKPLKYHVAEFNHVRVLVPYFIKRILEGVLGNYHTTKRLNGKVHYFLNLSQNRLYPVIKRLYYSLALFQYRKLWKKVRWEVVSEIPKSSVIGASSECEAEFYRGPEWINWRMKYKWMLSKNEVDISYNNYHFRGVRDEFRFIPLMVYNVDSKVYKGFLTLSLSVDNEMSTIKLLDYEFNKPCDSIYAFLLTLWYGKKHGADQIEFPDQMANYFKGCKLLLAILFERERLYAFRPKENKSPLGKALAKIELNYCDGDPSFT